MLMPCHTSAQSEILLLPVEVQHHHNRHVHVHDSGGKVLPSNTDSATKKSSQLASHLDAANVLEQGAGTSRGGEND
jgi:hypothetical protein